ARPQSVRRVPFVEYGCSKKGNGLPRCAIWSLGLACVGRRSSSGGRKWGRLHREAWTAQQPSQDSRRSALHREIVHDDWEGFLASLGNGECAATSLAVLCGVSSGGDLGAVLRPCALLGLTCVVVIGGLNRGAVDRALWSSQLRRRSSEWSLSLSLAPKELSVAASLSQLKAALGGANLIGVTSSEVQGQPSAVPLWEADLTHKRMAFVFGCDGSVAELPAEALPLLSGLAFVPCMGTDSSAEPLLARPGVSIAHTASLVAYERRRQLAMG
ncbi:unnamed protein product, partial [Polarella glacialis]